MGETARKYFDGKYGELTKDELRETAIELFRTQRGSYIMGQALYHGIKSLMAVNPPVMREQSNIADMYLLSELFFPFGVMDEIADRYGKEGHA